MKIGTEIGIFRSMPPNPYNYRFGSKSYLLVTIGKFPKIKGILVDRWESMVTSHQKLVGTTSETETVYLVLV